MRNRFRQVGLILFGLVLIAQSQPPAKTSLAVYPIKPAGADPALAPAITATLVAKLTPSPKLQVIEEAMLKTVMERQAMNVSDACDDTSCQVEIGKLVKAQKMITGSLAKMGRKYTLFLTLVNIQTGVTEFNTEDSRTCSEDNLDELVAAATTKIRNHFGENLPIPTLPVGQAFVPVAPVAPAPTNNPNVGAQLAAPGTGRASPAPTNQQFQEFHPQGAKGGPMVLVSDFKFYIDKFEVTNQDYQECVAVGVCREAPQKSGFEAPRQPVVFVDQNDARTYCQWAGKRLPKEQEWQEAAQGTDGRTYPWGNQEPNCTLANYADCGVKAALPVGSKPAGASPYGAMDMAGNVWEWVEEEAVYRGGGWFGGATGLRVSSRDTILARYRDLGFRCARD